MIEGKLFSLLESNSQNFQKLWFQIQPSKRLCLFRVNLLKIIFNPMNLMCLAEHLEHLLYQILVPIFLVEITLKFEPFFLIFASLIVQPQPHCSSLLHRFVNGTINRNSLAFRYNHFLNPVGGFNKFIQHFDLTLSKVVLYPAVHHYRLYLSYLLSIQRLHVSLAIFH